MVMGFRLVTFELNTEFVFMGLLIALGFGCRAEGTS